MHTLRLGVLSAALTAATLSAQATTYIAPSGYGTAVGQGGNAIPFWSTSSTYMQVHDAADLAAVFPTAAPVIKAISVRKSGTGTIVARTLDAQVTIAVTSVSAKTATTTFATNLGAGATIVLPYTNLSLPALSTSGTPNPQGWFFPFTTPFPYPIATGNLCWELRYKNCTTTGGSMDVADGGNARLGTLLGTGCIATGQTTAAAISRSLSLGTGTFSNILARGPLNAPAGLFIGDTQTTIALPGFCSAVETLPLVTLGGTTSATGTLTIAPVLGPLYFFPRGVTLYTQFAFLDAGLPGGVGVSNCAPTTTPVDSLRRIWFGTGTVQGNENALTGSQEPYAYGLVTGFDV